MEISEHAVERYAQRVGGTQEQARARIRAVFDRPHMRMVERWAGDAMYKVTADGVIYHVENAKVITCWTYHDSLMRRRGHS